MSVWPELDPGVTVVDIRAAEVRFRDPLVRRVPNAVVESSLQAIEKGQLRVVGPVLVVCEVGLRSRVAAMYLQADGVLAEHLPGGTAGLRRSVG